MDIQHIFDIIFAALGTLVMFILNDLHKKTNENAERIAAHKTYVAENYVHNSRLEKVEQGVENVHRRLDDIYNLLTQRKQ